MTHSEIDKKLKEIYANKFTTDKRFLPKKEFSFLKNLEYKIDIHQKNVASIINKNMCRQDIKNKCIELKEIQEKMIKKHHIKEKNHPELLTIKQEMQDVVNPNSYYERLGVNIVSIHVSEELLKLADPEIDGPLLIDIAQLRLSLTDSIGYIIPNVRLTDSLYLEKYQYSIHIRGQEVFKGCVSEKEVETISTSSIIENLKDISIKYVHQIMTKLDALKIIELVKSENPTLINDLIPTFLSSTDIKKILANLIHDGFSIKDILFIFEQLNDYARFTQDTDELTEILKKELMFYLED